MPRWVNLMVRSCSLAIAGTVLVVCAIGLVRGRRLWLRWLWLAILVDVGRWALLITSSYFEVQANINSWVSTASAAQSWLQDAVHTGLSVPLSLVLLWYWWRPLWRERVIGLQPEHAICIHCGYCLTGNVSGRCPECGHPIAC